MNNELEANKKHFSKSYNQQLILLSQTAGETDHEEKVAMKLTEASYTHGTHIISKCGKDP